MKATPLTKSNSASHGSRLWTIEQNSSIATNHRLPIVKYPYWEAPVQCKKRTIAYYSSPNSQHCTSLNCSRITYTPTTYTLTLTIVLLLLHHLVISSSVSTTAITFSAVFTCFHIVFHLAHLFAHLFERLTLERHCVVYGTWLFWTGYLLGVFVFHQHDILYNTISPTFLFWLLMLERRNAWGILVWEYVGWLDQPLTSSSSPPGWWQIGSIRLLAFRIWCLLGTGSFWGLLYLILATMAEDDTAASLFWLLQSRHLFELLLVSVAGGLMMITFWSFWTFQYRGILWHHELRKGVIVWYSEGLAFAGDIGWRDDLLLWRLFGCFFHFIS